jgi:hypothetical protein
MDTIYRFTEGEKKLLRREVKGFLPELPEIATEIDYHERAYLLGYGTDERNKFGSLENLQRCIDHFTDDDMKSSRERATLKAKA